MGILIGLRDFFAGFAPEGQKLFSRVNVDLAPDRHMGAALGERGRVKVARDVLGGAVYRQEFWLWVKAFAQDEGERRRTRAALQTLREWLDGGALPALGGGFQALGLEWGAAELKEAHPDGSALYGMELALTYQRRGEHGN